MTTDNKIENNAAEPLPLSDVSISGQFWQDFMEKVRTQVIPYQWDALNDRIPGAEPSYSMRNFRIAAGREKGKHGGFVFQDSDLAKWVEAAAYSLIWHPDPELEKTLDDAIDDIVAAQRPDGYLNSYYILNDMNQRFTNLMDNHELYCLGHFLEGAIADYKATGKDKLMNALVRYVDLVDSLIGPEEGKLHGYPGHEELELALVKLWDITGKESHLNLARYFIEQRGQLPLYFEEETKKGVRFPWENTWFQYHYYQAGEPVRDQKTAVGHSVRAMYLYTGMADVARRTGDESLMEACRTLWRNVTKRQMYVTGAIGSSSFGEAFTFDYDLPNDTVYGETCASIGLMFFAQRMLNYELRGEYGDVMEKCLYNGIISGMSADGKSFFYVNPLEVLPEASEKDQQKRHVKIQRQKWFGCACCPPNVARLLSSLAGYAYSKTQDALYIHLYVEGKIKTKFNSGEAILSIKTDYPWNGNIEIEAEIVPDTPFTLALRIPGWCASLTILLDGKEINPPSKDGYILLENNVQKGSKICLVLDMPVTLLEANPQVREDLGKICVTRGPIVYCLEEADCGKDLHRVSVDPKADFQVAFDPGFFGGATILQSDGQKLENWESGELYRPFQKNICRNIRLKWIPYYLWANREPGEMTVWVKSK